MIYDLVRVKWLDAMSDDNTWQDLSELRQQQLRTVETVGWIIQDFGNKIVTISSYDDECKTGGGGVVIPKENIVEIQHLEGGRIDEKGIRQQPLQD